ncbi:hypothetical protein VQ042_06515 [Aurantimonas sp. A2-1-M11]|uniref:hypothetical protein n=1 Tax=Aurantimonas sp. A2-1-M11 TaxID=3113712 RepID=UPI002F92E7A9
MSPSIKPTDGAWYVVIRPDGDVIVDAEHAINGDNDGHRVATFSGPDAVANATAVAMLFNNFGHLLEGRLPDVTADPMHWSQQMESQFHQMEIDRSLAASRAAA